jgi:hypothetical protein
MVYLALEEANFVWRDHEIRRFDELWREGKDIMTMAKIFKRPQFEVALLVMDRHLKGKIKKRKYGVFSEEFLMAKKVGA